MWGVLSRTDKRRVCVVTLNHGTSFRLFASLLPLCLGQAPRLLYYTASSRVVASLSRCAQQETRLLLFKSSFAPLRT